MVYTRPQTIVQCFDKTLFNVQVANVSQICYQIAYFLEKHGMKFIYFLNCWVPIL